MCVYPCYITHSALFTSFNWKDFTTYSPQITSETPGPFIYSSSCTFVECTCSLCAYHCVTIHNNVFTRDISSKLTTKQRKLGFGYVCVWSQAALTDVGNIALFQSFAPVIPAVVCHVNQASKSRKLREREKREWERIVHWCVGMSIIS